MTCRPFRRSYQNLKYQAKRKGEAFPLEWHEYVAKFLDAGRVHEQGHDMDYYRVARIDPTGPWSADNTHLVTGREHHRAVALALPKRERRPIKRYREFAPEHWERKP